jgi:iron complex outermembrane receptor protein
MKKIRRVWMVMAALGLVIMSGPLVFSQETAPDIRHTDAAIDEEFQWLKEEAVTTFVITASRVKEDIRKSPASITVITAEQIRQMGARNLMDVLRAVPGVSAWYHPDGHHRIDIRGISKVGGQDILFMVNSHPINNALSGGATWVHDTMSVDNIKQVEVIRGPGSALYGANAFGGVINVLTREGADINGGQISAGAGSDHTNQYNFLGGQAIGDFSYALNLNLFKTEGEDRFVKKDQQAVLDGIFHTNATRSPDYTEVWDEKFEAALTMKYSGFKLDSRVVERKRRPGISPLWTLNDENFNQLEDYFINLSYERNIWEGFDVQAKVYHNYMEEEAHYQGMTDGAVFMALTMTPSGPRVVPTPLQPEGLIAKPSYVNERTGMEFQATYKIGKAHTLVSGFTYEEIEQSDVSYSANFLYTPIPNVIIPLGSVRDLSAPQTNVNQDAERDFTAFFIQDIWDISDNLRLAMGARYDDYSDFGESFNPRAALVWEFIKGYDLKVMYGRAFRAPTFQELYTQNNPAVQGNPELDAETIDTYEVSLGARFMERLSARLTGFHSTIEDNITLVTLPGSQNGIFQNKEELRTIGCEAELKYELGKGSYLAMNYTYQDHENRDTGDPIPNLPRHKGDVMLNIAFSDHYNLNTDLLFQSDFGENTNGEIQSSFAILNATFIARELINGYKGLELRGSVYNLMNNKYDLITSGLPSSMEMEGITCMAELRYTF